MKKIINYALLGAILFGVQITTFSVQAQNNTRPAAPVPSMQRGMTVISPEVLFDNKVVFRLYAPKATEVSVNGEWSAGNNAVASMAKNDSGLWMLTTAPLPPELYGYTFTVDGVNVLDPNNSQVRRDGARNQNVLIVPGGGSELYAVNDIPHGALTKLWYESPTLGIKRRMYVYTPAGYDNGTGKYPVFYLLHGGGGDEDAWVTMGRAVQIMDNLIAKGKANPMIVVMANGNPEQMAAPGETPLKASAGPSFGMASGKFEESLVKDIIPYIESHYRTLTDQSNRAVAGLSMGGLQTQKVTLAYPGKFGYIGVWSMGVMEADAFSIDTKALARNYTDHIEALKTGGYKLYWIGCGVDDFLYTSVVNHRKILDTYNFRYIYRESTGGHTWTNWRIYLSEFRTQAF